MSNILLIDDRTDIPNDFKKAIELQFPDFKNKIQIWNKDNMDEFSTLYNQNKGDPDKVSNADEDIWKRALSKLDIDMVVVDHDLSGLDKVRISESIITNACKQLGIPVCTYHRKPPQTDSQQLKDKVNQARSFSIQIDIDPTNEYQNASKEIINILKGFQNLTTTISLLDDEILLGGPAKIISEVLKKPELESLFARYTSSSTLAADILQYDDGNEDENAPISEALKRRIPFILGCWLYNYVLPFPGIILNDVAAASYINIDLNQFKQYSSEFQSARYEGPFSESFSYWWRVNLEQLFFDENSNDAVDYLTKKEIPNILPCKCSVSGEAPAGYYCIVTQKPISYEESQGSLSWIPDGADLCRIHKRIYRRLAPMMGL